METDAPRAAAEADDVKAPWQPPQLTPLGSLASLTRANTLFAPDIGGSGTFAGDSGTTG